jgi:hypothetical protein
MAITFAEALAGVRNDGDAFTKAWSAAARVAAQRKRKKKQRSVDADWAYQSEDKRLDKRLRWGPDEIAKIQQRKPARHEFERLVDAIATGHRVPKYLAHSMARRQSPEAFRSYQAQGRQRVPAPSAKAAPSSAVRDFESAVDTFAANKHIGKCDAAAEVRRRAPQLFKLYQEAQ